MISHQSYVQIIYKYYIVNFIFIIGDLHALGSFICLRNVRIRFVLLCKYFIAYASFWHFQPDFQISLKSWLLYVMSKQVVAIYNIDLDQLIAAKLGIHQDLMGLYLGVMGVKVTY